jgi:hypothetical protein
MTDDKMLRISRYLTRARELETDPAQLKQVSACAENRQICLRKTKDRKESA